MTQKKRHIQQQGFTLIEVLVSITIGLVILTAIGAVFQTSTSIQRQREDQDEINEPTKLITNLLKINIAQAGYVDIFDAPNGTPQAASVLNAFKPEQANIYIRNPGATISTPLEQFIAGLRPVYGCDGAMSSKPNTLATATPPLSLSCGTASATQSSIQFAYQAVPTTANTGTFNSLAADNATTGAGRDCLQQTATGTRGIIINRFFIQASPADGVRELYCEGSKNTVAQPMARGVEEFVLRYQLAQPGTATFVAAGSGKSQYLTATQVSADSVGWAGVTAIEVCLITATPQTQTKSSAAAGTNALQPTRPTCTRASNGTFDANIARASGDLRLWKRSTFTYSVRNAVFASPA